MPTTWVLVPYKRSAETHHPGRYVAIDDFTPQIRADGGDWSETEVLGPQMGYALVKIRMQTASLLVNICATPGFRRMPVDNFFDRLLGLSPAQISNINGVLLNAGYSQSEIDTALGGDWSQKTLADLMRLWATRRLTPRYDSATDAIICDGTPVVCKSVDTVNSEVF